MKILVTPLGAIEYTLSYKPVQNLNLRVKSDGAVKVSAPLRMSPQEIESFISSKASWILSNQARMRARPKPSQSPYTIEESTEILQGMCDEVYPLFAGVLNGVPPKITVKDMKSRWGVCYPKRKELAFSSLLTAKPREAMEYVVMHEFVHFVYPDHQEGFHKMMEELMPNYRQRRKKLQG